MLQRLTGFGTGVFGPTNSVVSEIKQLQDMYKQRQAAFNRWYKLLSMEDELQQDNMESFVGNDPRTTWNMGVFLLQPKPLNIRILNHNGAVIPVEARVVVNDIQAYFTTLWRTINKKNQRRGQETWFWKFIGLLVATGWYAVPYLMDNDGKVEVDFWNPANVYPEFSDNPNEGLLRLAKIRTISAAQALRNVEANTDWDLNGSNLTGRVVEGHLWKLTAEGITHAVIMNNRVVKQPKVIPGMQTIQVLVGAIAGIPKFNDDLKDSSDTIGQSILATSEPSFKAFNKLQSFNMQLLRDTANPRVLEKSTGNTAIIKDAETWYKRGAMFRAGPQDSVEVIQMPGIPVELTQILFTIRNQMQRGGFSDLTFGNIIGEVTASLVTQAAEAALQLISPYQESVIYVTSESTNSWYHIYLNNPNLRPSSWPEIPDEILEKLKETYEESDYAIKIPGDLGSRISLAKQLNEKLRVPVKQVMALLLPEITNIPATIAELDAEDAKAHPAYSTIQLIQAFEQAAAEARAADNSEQAILFDNLVDNLTKEVTGEATVHDKLGTTPPGVQVNGVFPPEIESRLGIGRV